MINTDPIRFELLRRAWRRYQFQIDRLLKRGQFRPRSLHSDDAKQLQFNHTVQTLLKGARDLLAAHQARVNNPHQETAVSMSTMTAAEIVALANSKMSAGFLPLSHYGFSNLGGQPAVTNAWVSREWKVTAYVPMKGMLNGTPFTMPYTELDLQALYPTRHANNRFDVAIVQRLGVISYRLFEVDKNPIPIRKIDTLTYMYIGTISTGDLGVTNMDIRRVVRIDGLRISENPIGSAIPTSPGEYDTPNVKLKSGW